MKVIVSTKAPPRPTLVFLIMNCNHAFSRSYSRTSVCVAAYKLRPIHNARNTENSAIGTKWKLKIQILFYIISNWIELSNYGNVYLENVIVTLEM